jgi:hypothetical protein
VCRSGGKIIGETLISSSFPNRNVYKLIFLIVYSQGKIRLEDLAEYKKELELIRSVKQIPQIKHPIVQRWLQKHIGN